VPHFGRSQNVGGRLETHVVAEVVNRHECTDGITKRQRENDLPRTIEHAPVEDRRVHRVVARNELDERRVRDCSDECRAEESPRSERERERDESEVNAGEPECATVGGVAHERRPRGRARSNVVAVRAWQFDHLVLG